MRFTWPQSLGVYWPERPGRCALLSVLLWASPKRGKERAVAELEFSEDCEVVEFGHRKGDITLPLCWDPQIKHQVAKSRLRRAKGWDGDEKRKEKEGWAKEES